MLTAFIVSFFFFKDFPSDQLFGLSTYNLCLFFKVSVNFEHQGLLSVYPSICLSTVYILVAVIFGSLYVGKFLLIDGQRPSIVEQREVDYGSFSV